MILLSREFDVCTETLSKVMKQSMKWPHSIQWDLIKMFVSDTPSLCDRIWPHVKLFGETFNIR